MLSRGFQGNYPVIPNVVDTRVFRPLDTAKSGPYRFVHVSGFRPVKRVDDIVRTAVELLHNGRDIELHLVGDGPTRKLAETVARNAGFLGEKIIFHGARLDEGVADVVRKADCSVLFSDFENSPCVVGEALASGIPMLATNIAGIPEHVSAKRGILIPKGEISALGTAMAELIRRGRSWDQTALRHYAVSTFSPEVIGRMFDEEYRLALGMAPGAGPRSASPSEA